MDDGLSDILEQCLVRLADGATVDECLAAYPAQQAKLELPLRMAVRLRKLPQPALPVSARTTLETQMLALAAGRRAAGPAMPTPQAPLPIRWPDAILAGVLRALGYGGPLSRPWLRLAAAAIAVVLVLVLSAGALAAARAILQVIQPQPTLAPTSAPIAPTPTAPAFVPMTLDAPIEQIAQEGWIVGGMTVVITSTTSIQGAPAPGAMAHVRGTVQKDGALLAQSILIESLPTPISTPPNGAPTETAAPAATAVLADTPAPAPPDDLDQPDDPKQPCQGRQHGRDDKKCEPKPHDNGKPPKPKK